MDGDLETGFYGAVGTAGVALSLAGGLAAWPTIARFASAEFAIPAFTFGGGGLALAGGGSTGGTMVIGTITGSEILGLVGLGTITALFMRIGDGGIFHDNGEPFSNSEANQLADQHRELKRSLQEMLDEMSEFSPLRPGIQDTLAEVVRDLGAIIRYIASLGR